MEMSNSLLHSGIPVVLNRIIRSSWQAESYLRPTVSLEPLEKEESPLFVILPRLLAYLRV